MRTIALVNQKGGCGKTTTAVNLAACLAAERKRTLLVDMDPQGHAGLGLGIQSEEVEKSIYEVLMEQINITEVIHIIHENLHIAISDVMLSAFEQVMSGVEGREYRLAKSLGDVTAGYDYLVIDCPPSIGLLTFNALMVAGEVIVPVDPSCFSLHGLSRLLNTLELLEKRKNRTVSLKILATNMDDRTRYAKSVMNTLWKNFPNQCFSTVIHTSTRVREAAGRGKSLAEYDRNCRAFEDYQKFSREVLKSKPVAVAAKLSVQRQQSQQKSVVFHLEAPAYADVRIAGDFNNWNPEALSFCETLKKPRWQKLFSLKPGSYRYKYLLDGQWIADPDNDKTVDDSFGGINSLINI